jgi:hypothetical protein
VPDFKEYRNSLSEDPAQLSKKTNDDKHTLSYITTFGVGLATAYGAKAIVRDIVANVAPSADVLALAKIEVKLSEIPVGKSMTFKWRSKPLFVRHRTEDEIKTEAAVDLSTLRDPQHDNARAKMPEWLVLLGICTHLGKICYIYLFFFLGKLKGVICVFLKRLCSSGKCRRVQWLFLSVSRFSLRWFGQNTQGSCAT